MLFNTDVSGGVFRGELPALLSLVDKKPLYRCTDGVRRRKDASEMMIRNPRLKTTAKR
jgi:hypothetical protein